MPAILNARNSDRGFETIEILALLSNLAFHVLDVSELRQTGCKYKATR